MERLCQYRGCFIESSPKGKNHSPDACHQRPGVLVQGATQRSFHGRLAGVEVAFRPRQAGDDQVHVPDLGVRIGSGNGEHVVRPVGEFVSMEVRDPVQGADEPYGQVGIAVVEREPDGGAEVVELAPCPRQPHRFIG